LSRIDEFADQPFRKVSLDYEKVAKRSVDYEKVEISPVHKECRQASILVYLAACWYHCEQFNTFLKTRFKHSNLETLASPPNLKMAGEC